MGEDRFENGEGRGISSPDKFFDKNEKFIDINLL